MEISLKVRCASVACWKASNTFFSAKVSFPLSLAATFHT